MLRHPDRTQYTHLVWGEYNKESDSATQSNTIKCDGSTNSCSARPVAVSFPVVSSPTRTDLSGALLLCAVLFTGFESRGNEGTTHNTGVPWRKSALRLESLLSCRLAILEMPLQLKCSTSRLPISGSRLSPGPASLQNTHRIGDLGAESAHFRQTTQVYSNSHRQSQESHSIA